MGLEIVTEGQNCDSGRHLRLHCYGHIEDELLALLDSTGVENKSLVAVRASRQVSQGGDGMALDFFVVC